MSTAQEAHEVIVRMLHDEPIAPGVRINAENADELAWHVVCGLLSHGFDFVRHPIGPIND
jgi:hypothetical protein